MLACIAITSPRGGSDDGSVKAASRILRGPAVVKMIIVVVVTFALCWLLYHVYFMVMVPGPPPRPRSSSTSSQVPGPRSSSSPTSRMVLETISRIIKVQLPAYLRRLPLPETVGGFTRLTVSEWLRLLPLLGILALLGYLTVRPFLPKKKKQRDSLINLKIQKENPKVVNEIDIEDLNSANFPVCDKSHIKHNELTGDNVGPLILKKKIL
ncbi:hypothetical protein CRUP_025690 [Coryphaenoides rupestris]|nr:hypothetical protein CRUP_025690 [Coryphaenoides rupestris]